MLRDPDWELERLLFAVRQARIRLAQLLQRTREQRAAFELATKHFENISRVVPKRLPRTRRDDEGDGA